MQDTKTKKAAVFNSQNKHFQNSDIFYFELIVCRTAVNTKFLARIDFTPRRSSFGCEVRFLPGNLIDFTPRRSGSGRKVNFYQILVEL